MGRMAVTKVYRNILIGTSGRRLSSLTTPMHLLPFNLPRVLVSERAAIRQFLKTRSR